MAKADLCQKPLHIYEFSSFFDKHPAGEGAVILGGEGSPSVHRGALGQYAFQPRVPAMGLDSTERSCRHSFLLDGLTGRATMLAVRIAALGAG